jgi:hypothetical protein
MSLKEQIAALPGWPVLPPINLTNASVEIQWLDESLTAALFRLMVAREWIESCGHEGECDKQVNPTYECTCGRDELLKALEMPK